MSLDRNAAGPDKPPRFAAWLIAASTVIVVLLFVFVDPIAQDPAYHEFADVRRLFTIPNFWNVASNFPFLVVGLYGIWFVQRYPQLVREAALHRAWQVLYAGVLLTAFGSAYFHLAPGNATLVWDRLPMTIAFSGLFTIIIGEYLSVRAARILLIPLLLAGAASVIYWDYTEANGAGDLRPYAVVQFLPMILSFAILIVYRRASDMTAYLWLMLGLYSLSKVFEHFDAELFGILGLISGHSLKHIVASLGPLALLGALRARNRVAHKDASHESTNL